MEQPQSNKRRRSITRNNGTLKILVSLLFSHFIEISPVYAVLYVYLLSVWASGYKPQVPPSWIPFHLLFDFGLWPTLTLEVLSSFSSLLVPYYTVHLRRHRLFFALIFFFTLKLLVPISAGALLKFKSA